MNARPKLGAAKDFWQSEDGTASLEATFLYPSLLIVTLAMVFFTIVVYQRASLHYKARQVADQVAYTWNNNSQSATHKETPFDGSFTKYTSQADGDGLYWRIFGNDFLGTMGLDFFNGSGAAGRKISFADTQHGKSSVAVKCEFESNVLMSTNQVKVTATSAFNGPAFLTTVFGVDDQMVAVAYADIHDPVEMMRNIRLSTIIMKEIIKNQDGLKSIAETLGLL